MQRCYGLTSPLSARSALPGQRRLLEIVVPVARCRLARSTRTATAGRRSVWGGANHAGDPDKGAGKIGVVGGGGMQRGDVGVDQPDPQGPAALDAGDGEVAAGRDGPWHVDQPRQVAEEAARLRLNAPLQVAA